MFSMIGKADGGTCLIAWLGSLFRACAAVRMPVVQEWARASESPCFYASAQEGSSDAVADQPFTDDVGKS